MDRSEWKMVTAWAVLIALTLVSFAASDSWFGAATVSIASVVILAMVKVRVVILHFMDVGEAPLALRIVLEAWVVCLAIVLILLSS